MEMMGRDSFCSSDTYFTCQTHPFTSDGDISYGESNQLKSTMSPESQKRVCLITPEPSNEDDEEEDEKPSLLKIRNLKK